jgi:hypothetical protein
MELLNDINTVGHSNEGAFAAVVCEKASGVENGLEQMHSSRQVSCLELFRARQVSCLEQMHSSRQVSCLELFTEPDK